MQIAVSEYGDRMLSLRQCKADGGGAAGREAFALTACGGLQIDPV